MEFQGLAPVRLAQESVAAQSCRAVELVGLGLFLAVLSAVLAFCCLGSLTDAGHFLFSGKNGMLVQTLEEWHGNTLILL